MPPGMRNCSEKRGMTPFNREAVLEILFDSEARLTARAYILQIAGALSIPPSKAKKILKDLVNDQTLAYQELYGATYVMESFSKPVRITDRFFITPPGIAFTPRPHEFDIRIFPGISFGSGHHPTTRLCLQALDHLFFKLPEADRPRQGETGDIGTGSGILAIAMCLAGMDRCRAWEIDANAVSEARRNVTANSLGNRVSIIEDLMSPDNLSLTLLTANLRFPTLKQLAPLILEATAPGAPLVFSGLRTWEKEALLSHYKDFGFSCIWDKDEKNWSSVILRTVS